LFVNEKPLEVPTALSGLLTLMIKVNPTSVFGHNVQQKENLGSVISSLNYIYQGQLVITVDVVVYKNYIKAVPNQRYYSRVYNSS